ncbi:hypothetical protein NJ76_23945 [Rhodococcus sp. IITR03]|nr:hypothetical protein NJ76_23945 [Rhodococcus sp. IITR03]
MAHENYQDIDPSHPLGGKDGGRDATCTKDGQRYIMAVYFPRGQQSFTTIASKFADDLNKAVTHDPEGFVFVTNQELRLGERENLRSLGEAQAITVDLFHLERIAGILDRPPMAPVRRQYLDIDSEPGPLNIDLQICGAARYLTDTDDLLEWWIEEGARTARARLRERHIDTPTLPWWKPVAKAPQSEEELDERLERWEKTVRAGWPTSLQHLAATSWPGLRLRVRNNSEAFLHEVQVIITIDGVLGLGWQHPERFEMDLFLPPVLPAPEDPYAFDSSYIDDLRPVDYPVSWRNIDGAVEITVDLKHLRPHPAWESDDSDIVLFLDHPHPPVELSAEWTVTAQGYGTVHHGAALPVAVEAMPCLDSFQVVVDANQD